MKAFCDKQTSVLRLKKIDRTVGTDQIILYTCLPGIMPNKGQQNARSIDTCPRSHPHVCDEMIKRSKTRSQMRQQWSRARSFVREVNTPWERQNFGQNRGWNPYVKE